MAVHSPPARILPILAACALLAACGDGFPTIDCFNPDDCESGMVCRQGECVPDDGDTSDAGDVGDAGEDVPPDDAGDDADTADVPEDTDTEDAPPDAPETGTDTGTDADATDVPEDAADATDVPEDAADATDVPEDAADADLDVADTSDTTDTDTDTDTDDTTDCEVTNPCGGCTTLSETIGETCGACDEQTWVCDGTDAVVCDTETACPTCDDDLLNGDETGTDCGGPDCDPCDAGLGCDDGWDCDWNLACVDDICSDTARTDAPAGALADGQRLGEAVAFQRRRAIVGAPGTGTGVVVIAQLGEPGSNDLSDFDVVSPPTDATSGMEFGASVATDGFGIVIGAPGDSTNGANSGRVYYMRPSMEGFQGVSIATGESADDRMGATTGVGGMVTWGAPGAGTVEFGLPVGSSVDRITSVDSAPTPATHWGSALSFDSNYALVATLTTVRAFRSGDSWTDLPFSLESDIGSPVSVAASFLGGAIGAPAHPGGGQVIVLTLGESSASVDGRIMAPEGVSEFGRAIARSGDRIAVSGRITEDDRGAVFVYGRLDGEWVLEARMRDVSEVEDSEFGHAIGLSDDRIVVGAPDAADGDGTFVMYNLCPLDRHGAGCAYSCSDETRNGTESDEDCGGSICRACYTDEGCRVPGDCEPGNVCQGGVCTAVGPPG